jgi:uroporphyrinogen-III decarboxylase
MSQVGLLAALAAVFAQMSLLAFGGGTSVLGEMQRQVVEVHPWMSAQEFAALYALAQAAPGPNMLVTTLIGWRVAGLPGALIATGANVLGIDWRFPLADARRLLPRDIGLQGNLAPALLSDATPEAVGTETLRLLETMRGRNGYIFNLGHGVPPEAKLENIAALVETVCSFK